jgi:hypothetical protein
MWTYKSRLLSKYRCQIKTTPNVKQKSDDLTAM